jgi:hypothetical protein
MFMSRLRRRSNRASFDEAADAILSILADRGWHKRTAEIGLLSPWVADAMFGEVKAYYKIKHQRVGGGPGSYFEWHLCVDCADLPIDATCPSAAYVRDST